MFSGQSLLAGKRILVVEDEYFIADELARSLADLGAPSAWTGTTRVSW